VTLNAHIMHMCASWYGKQCWFGKFLFPLRKKIIFHFISIKNKFFCEAPTKTMLQEWTTTIQKKNQKNTNHSCCVMLCDLVARKNNKFRILQTFWKSVHKKELYRTKFHGFQARWASYGFNHDIVLCNNPILCIYVPLEWQTIFILCVFLFFGIKSSFLFF
jgi:hypothetical protein